MGCITYFGEGMVLRKFALVAACVAMAGGAQAVTLDIVGGQLMGASNVLVDGSLYDVQFREGTCIELFNGCDDNSDFAPLQSFAFAQLALAALGDQVFIDTGVAGEEFFSEPSLTNGCSLEFQCWVRAPFSLFTSSHPVGFINLVVGKLEGAYTIPPNASQAFRDDDTSGSEIYVYSVWSAVPEPAPVPVLPLPGIALLVASLLGVGAGSLRRSRRASPRPELV
jgi:hypothetical protein